MDVKIRWYSNDNFENIMRNIVIITVPADDGLTRVGAKRSGKVNSNSAPFFVCQSGMGQTLERISVAKCSSYEKTVIDYIFYLVIFFGNRLIWSAVPTLVDSPNPPKSVTSKRPTPKQRTSRATKRQRVTEGNIYIYIYSYTLYSQELPRKYSRRKTHGLSLPRKPNYTRETKCWKQDCHVRGKSWEQNQNTGQREQ